MENDVPHSDDDRNGGDRNDESSSHLPEDGDATIPLYSVRGTTPADPDESQTNLVPDPKPTRQTIGPYKLLQKIGEGGMGTVWLAEQERPIRRRVALKLIRADRGSKEIVARFEAERQAIAMMDHQNIAKVLDAGTTEDGAPFFAMELVQGEPITQYCDRHKLSIEERLQLFVPVCKAVQHAHQKGIIHRDLKPSNVLVCLLDGKPVPKVIDFGLAKALHQQIRLTDKTMFTELGQIVGTVQYMSPEQAELSQLDIDTRTDIYSLGVMLYELLTGSTPIDLKSVRQRALLQVLATIREQEPPRPSARLSSSTNEAVSDISKHRKIPPDRLKRILQGELDWIVMKSLEKDRTRRYETAIGFAKDIENYLSGDVVVARPPTFAYRTRKYLLKNRGLAISVSSIVAILIAALAGISWFARSESIAKRDAIDAKRFAEETAEMVYQAALETQRINELAVTSQMAAEAQAEIAESEAAKARVASTSAALYASRVFADSNQPSLAQSWLWRIAPEQRNIEWNLAYRAAVGAQVHIVAHGGDISGLIYSPDGKRLYSTSSQDGFLRWWDPWTGQMLGSIRLVNQDIAGMVMSHDGSKLVIYANQTSDKASLIVMDCEQMTEVQRCDVPESFRLADASYHPRENVVAILNANDSSIWKYEVESNQLATLFSASNQEPQPLGYGARSLFWTEDGQKIASDCEFSEESGESTHVRRIWDWRTNELVTAIEDSAFGQSSAIPRPGTNQFLILNPTTATLVNERFTFVKQLEVLDFSYGPSERAVISNDGAIVIFDSQSDFLARAFDLNTGEQLLNVYLPNGYDMRFAFDPRCTHAAVSTSDGDIFIYDVRNLRSSGSAFSFDGQLADCRQPNDIESLLTWTMDGEHVSVQFPFGKIKTAQKPLRLDDPCNILTVGQPPDVEPVIVSDELGEQENNGVQSNDGRKFAAIHRGQVHVWDTTNGSLLFKTSELRSDKFPILEFSPDGLFLVVQLFDSGVSLIDVTLETEVCFVTTSGPWEWDPYSRPARFSWAADSSRLAVLQSPSQAEMIQPATGEVLQQCHFEISEADSIALNGDASRVVASGYGEIQWIDLDDGETFRRIGEFGGSLKFSSDDRRLLLAEGSKLQFIEPQLLESIGPGITLAGVRPRLTADANFLITSDSGHFFVAPSFPPAIGEGRELISRIGRLSRIEFSPDGRWIAAGILRDIGDTVTETNVSVFRSSDGSEAFSVLNEPRTIGFSDDSSALILGQYGFSERVDLARSNELVRDLPSVAEVPQFGNLAPNGKLAVRGDLFSRLIGLPELPAQMIRDGESWIEEDQE